MKRFLRILVRVIAVILLGAGMFVGYACYSVHTRMAKTYAVTVPATNIAADPALLERGHYLTTKVAICADCHGDNLGGKAMSDDMVFGRLYAENLTTGKGGIASRYTDEDFL